VRPNAAQRGYDSKWQNYRRRYLRENPSCRLCYQAGRLTRATVVDHIAPHKGDFTQFWARSNHQALCQTCHDGTKKQFEKTGTLRGCDENGTPLDPQHHWGRG
jgi:5-methylcytosine-specific restriction enzyme A